MTEAPATSSQCRTSLPRHSAEKGSASAPLSTLLPFFGGYKNWTCSGMCWNPKLPWRCTAYKTKACKLSYSTNRIKPLFSLYALKQHWTHNVASGLNIKVRLQAAKPLETVKRNDFVSWLQSQSWPNYTVLQPSKSQTQTNQLLNVNMSWRSSTHLYFPTFGAVYPHFFHGLYILAIIADFRFTVWRPSELIKHHCLKDSRVVDFLVLWALNVNMLHL